ncbi:3-phosphoshikimate 1-carboxyvinyltransferase [Thermosulfuriphilus sp.]
MDLYKIRPLKGPLKARVRVPGSKSITQRAMVCAALAEGISRLDGCLVSEDTVLLRRGLSGLGARFEDRDGSLLVAGTAGKISLPPGLIYMGNNGTGIRFLTAVCALGRGGAFIIGSRRMDERPIKDLIEALSLWGLKAYFLKESPCPPVYLEAQGLFGGPTKVSVAKSSQYLSALLLVGPYTQRQAEIKLGDSFVSEPYVAMTQAVMKAFGVDTDRQEGLFRPGRGPYLASHYQVEADASSASYFLAAAAICGGEVTVLNLPQTSLQGDAAFAGILAQMGCRVSYSSNSVTVSSSGHLQGLELDMGRWPDLVPTLASVAAFANGRTVIRNVAHLRIKETDRLAAVATELRRLGGIVEELEDGLIIEGKVPLKGATIETYDDHRIAMAFSLIGLKVAGVKIKDPGCVAKSFPQYWEVFESLYPR